MKTVLSCLALALLASPGLAEAPSIQPGNWDVTSTAVDLMLPGTPGLLLRMMRGKSKVDHKCIAPDQARTGLAAIVAPDPKAKCRVESLTVTGNRFDQVMACPNKDGGTLRIARSGSFTVDGFTARMTMTGQSPKGAMRVVVDQVAKRTAPSCRS